MSITWTEDGDGRANLGPDYIMQSAIAQFSASDYSTGGYPVNPQSFGLARLRGLHLTRATGLTANPSNIGYNWVLNGYSATPGVQSYHLQAFNGTTEASSNTDFSNLTLTFVATGPY